MKIIFGEYKYKVILDIEKGYYLFYNLSTYLNFSSGSK